MFQLFRENFCSLPKRRTFNSWLSIHVFFYSFIELLYFPLTITYPLLPILPTYRHPICIHVFSSILHWIILFPLKHLPILCYLSSLYIQTPYTHTRVYFYSFIEIILLASNTYLTYTSYLQTPLIHICFYSRIPVYPTLLPPFISNLFTHALPNPRFTDSLPTSLISHVILYLTYPVGCISNIIFCLHILSWNSPSPWLLRTCTRMQLFFFSSWVLRYKLKIATYLVIPEMKSPL